MSRPAIVVAALLLVIGVVGAVRALTDGGDEPPAQSLGTEHLPDVDGPPPRAKSYESLDEFVAAFESEGFECSEFMDMGTEGQPTLLGFGICDVGDVANRFDLYLYRSPSARDRWFESRINSGLPWLYGPNWIVVVAGEPQTAARRLELVQNALGGQVGPTS